MDIEDSASPVLRPGRMDLPALSFASLGSETPCGDPVSPDFSLSKSAVTTGDASPHSSSSGDDDRQVRRTLDGIVRSIEEGGDILGAIREARRQLEIEDTGGEADDGAGSSPLSDSDESGNESEELGDSSDGDLTVECASPRDPMDVVSEEQTTRPPGPLNPLREPHSTAETSSVACLPRSPLVERELPGSSAMYLLRKIFPIVYEQIPPTTKDSDTALTERSQHEHPRIATPNPPKKAIKPVATDQLGTKEPRTSGLHKQIDELKHQLEATSKTLSTQLQIAETERRQVLQRNARLKSQLEVLTADLTRTKTEAAKWKTENEFYATKLPKIQADLADGTTQLDEKQAQAIQSQLEITQLRAKVQVMQTRCGNLDAHAEKLQQELRAAKNELRKRSLQLQQHEEKVKRLETELCDEKASHMHDLAHAKTKLATTIQRMEHERNTLAAELKKTHQQSIEEAKAVANTAIKKRKEVERSHLNATQQLASMKKRLEECEEANVLLAKNVKSLEHSLRRAEQTETTLRAKLSSYALQLQSAECEKKKLVRAASVVKPTTPAPKVRTLPRDKIRHHEERSETQDEDDSTQRNEPRALLCSCCQAIVAALHRADEIESLDEEENQPAHSSSISCARCDALEAEAVAAQEELQRVCTLHAKELKIQAATFERMLRFRGALAS